jgi:prepilin-type N-terminal cleavage/methylation domain-containing protein
VNHLRHQLGYTLVEVIAATAIFLIAVLALSGLLMQGYRAMGAAGKRSVALHYTQQEIEAVIQNLDATENVEVIREEDYYMDFEGFGISVKGTLITVKYTYPGQSGGGIAYVTFIPDTEELE